MAAELPTRRTQRAPRRRASVLGVLGELFITVGVVALMYVSWQMWIGDWIIGSQQRDQASAISETWASAAPTAPATTPAPLPTESEEPAEPVIPVLAQPAHGDLFGVMLVPRFGADWNFEIRAGTSRKDILDLGKVGHYNDTAMPGAMGNTVYAGHRWGSGAVFDPIDKLVIGDAIVIQTPEGWYTYRFRTLEYVRDTQVEVLLPVPQEVGIEANARYLTLTSCSPKLNMLERVIAYAIFDDFTPTADGPPASLTEGVTA